jgi:signal transduction histidine kinase/DNA-binding response OmpR family regulator
VSPAFHRDYPPAAATFLSTLHRLSEALNPSNQSPSRVTAWDEIFRAAYTDSMEFWRFSALQLDHLLEDQIAHVKRERNAAIGLAGLIVITLLPLTWLYFSRYIRPVVQDMVDEVQEASEAAAKAKNQFLAMMSHEIRTPMNGVIGFANLLSETRLDEQQRDFVRTITGSSEALLTVINDILDYTKLEAGRVELESRPVARADLIEDVLGLHSAAASAKRLELVYWIEPDVPPIVSTDPTRLRQVLLNLAGNAVKFTATGHVELTVTRATGGSGRDRLSFHVRDTGIGISADRIGRLFKPFSQVDSSITRTHGGTGLGLAISRRLVEAMGGEIGVTSVAGQGTDFHFTIVAPAAKRSEETDPGSNWSVSDVERALRGRRILVIHDYEANRRLFERIFEPHGARVTSVDSAEAAQAVLARETFDLAILDYMMPVMDGITLARHLTAMFPALPLMLVTSVHLSPGDSAAALFAAVVTKPIRNRKFVATVISVLRGGGTAAEPGRPAAPDTGAATPKAPPFALQHPLRILAVDDNPVNLRVISMMLTSLGYAPAVTDRAEKALERLRTDPFDLVLMDVQMPEIDGLEATRRLRGGECGPLNRQVRVVALTAGASQEEREACRAAGMDDFILKPVTRPVLTEVLRVATSAGKRS